MKLRAVLIGSTLAVILAVLFAPWTIVMVTGRPLSVECVGEAAACDDYLLRRTHQTEGELVTWVKVENLRSASCYDVTFGYWWPFFDPFALHASPIVLVAWLAGCAPPVGEPVEINVHCGLTNSVVQFEGQEWMFSGVDDSTAPRLHWGLSASHIFTVRRVSAEELIAVGPGNWYRYTLVPADESGSGCL